MTRPTYTARATRADVQLGRERKIRVWDRAHALGLTPSSYVRAVLDLAFSGFTAEEIYERADKLTRSYNRVGT